MKIAIALAALNLISFVSCQITVTRPGFQEIGIFRKIFLYFIIQSFC